MSGPLVVGAGGPMALGPVIGRGGEGRVFALVQNERLAVKIYDRPDAAREAKIASMVAARIGQRCAEAAFPLASVRDGAGRFSGFLMTRVDGALPLHEMYSPAARRRAFPTADWRLLVRAAGNVARLFRRVHETGAVIGDVNASGFLVSARATVTAIDADSFQWTVGGVVHGCRVGVPEYTPPELQGASLDGVVRTIDHDGFGLAVLVFQMIFLGRHPHAGMHPGREVALSEAIRAGMFAYSRLGRHRVAPPPGTLTLDHLPLGIATLFERAFHRPGQRPTPLEWIVGIEELEDRLRRCAVDDRHHHAGGPLGCPWCRLPRGPLPAFGIGRPVTAGADTMGAVEREVVRIIGLAAGSTGEAVVPPPQTGGTETGDGSPVSAGGRDGGTDAADGAGRDPAAGTRKTSINALGEARRRLDVEIDAWRTRIGAWSAARAAQELREALAFHRMRTARDALRVGDVDFDLRLARAAEALRLVMLDANSVSGVGPKAISQLRAEGITTAADIWTASVASVPGLSTAARANLLLWRNERTVAEIRAAIVPPPVLAGAVDRTRRDLKRQAEAREASLLTAAKRLERSVGEVLRGVRTPDRTLEAAMRAVTIAEADLRRQGFDLAFPTPVRPKPTRKANAKPTGVRKSRACPICGGGMVRRWARNGRGAGRWFLGCAAYPICTGSRPLRT